MFVGIAKISLHFPSGSSLKEKRQHIKSIVERTKNRFNVSIAEVEDQELWQKTTIGIAYVSLTDFQAKKTLSSIRDFIDSLGRGIITDYLTEIVKL